VSFSFRHLDIPEIVVIESERFVDARGSFLECYKHSTFAAHGIPDTFVQDNCSRSVRHVLRGLHYQKPPAAQAKLLCVVTGQIFDVAVDIRKGSPTFGRWTSASLSPGNLVYVPTGFAHGFVVLSADATVIYKTTAEYDPVLERGIIWSDPTIGIQWPVNDPVLSDKDRRLPTLAQVDNTFVYDV
jgi:dTDP-4-dehydrorhamnose 3,5-epimerase